MARTSSNPLVIGPSSEEEHIERVVAVVPSVATVNPSSTLMASSSRARAAEANSVEDPPSLLPDWRILHSELRGYEPPYLSCHPHSVVD